MTDILALDIATVTGWARGRIDQTPRSGSHRFGTLHDGHNEVFAAALQWFGRFLATSPVPDLLIIESLLPPEAMLNRTSRQVRDRLAGLHGVIRAQAKSAGIGEIAEARVGDVRAHFIGVRHARRVIAKRDTVEKCRSLGWPCADDNAGDALALWHFAASQIDPRLALQVSPLFKARVKG